MPKENKENEYQEFTFEVSMQVSQVEKTDTENIECASGDSKGVVTRRAIAIVGDKIIKGNFMPAVELKKSAEAWNGTLHDINHMGTTRITAMSMYGMTGSDIRYFVGWQDNIQYDEESKSVSMDIHIDENTMYGKTLKSFIELCDKAGKVPNVSISFFAKRRQEYVKNLPIDYEAYGLDPEDKISYIYDIHPRALSTVLEGACSDKDGCGISKQQENNCDLDGEIEKKRQELIKELKKLDEEE